MKLLTKIATALMIAGSGPVLGGTAQASTITYSLPDIGSFQIDPTPNSGQTFSGNGFIGEYAPNIDPGTPDGEFSHLFSIQGDVTVANAEVDISALAGAIINSATVSFHLASSDSSGTATVVGYNGTGSLSYLFAAPALTLGSASGLALSTTVLDVKTIVSAAVANGDQYLGLLFSGDIINTNYTLTDLNADAAQVRLTVDYAVPEPTSIALLGFSLAGVGAVRRRRVLNG